MRSFLLLLFVVFMLALLQRSPIVRAAEVDGESNIVNVASEQDGLQEMLHTETVLIDTLKDYVSKLSQKIALIKSKTQEFQAIHNVAVEDIEKYINNPLNSLTILKRFTDDWNALMAFAANDEHIDAVVSNYTGIRENLQFPNEEDYDEAVGNLLRIQDIYHLEPQPLSLGEVNGVKVGSEMSWNDCLEIGREWNKNGDHIMAKFWMETALSKLPSHANSTKPKETVNANVQNDAKFKIMQVLLSAEFQMGNLNVAMEIVNSLHKMKPSHKGVLKDKAIITEALKKNVDTNQFDNNQLKAKKKSNKNKRKSSEQLLIEEICRSSSATTTFESGALSCYLESNNLNAFVLRPQQVEILSIDPYIAIHHNVLTTAKIDELKSFVHEVENVNDELQFTGIGQKRLSQLTAQKFSSVLGHSAALYEQWQVERRTYEHLVDYESTLMGYAGNGVSKIQANVVFNLQTPKLGGSIVFPQLSLKIDVPQNSLLYWTNLNEFHEADYRTKQYVCPVIAGSQTTVYTGIRRA